MVSPPIAPLSPDTIPTDSCVRIVEAAAQSCQSSGFVEQLSADSYGGELEAVSVSLSALANAFTYGSIVLAILAVVAGLAWGKLVAVEAEKEAKQAAKDCAKEYIDKWMSENAPQIIRRQVDLLNDATIGGGDDSSAADEIGREA